MTILSLLESGHSKEITNQIINGITSGKFKMSELMDCFFSENNRICQRAAWSVGIIGEKNQDLLLPYLDLMIERASNPVHNAVKRNVVRAIQHMNIPVEKEGLSYDFCYALAANHQEAIAVKCFAFIFCFKVALKHTELLTEIEELMFLLTPDNAPAVQSVLRQARRKWPK